MDITPLRTLRQFMNLRQGRNDWYSIKNSAAPGVSSQVFLYDEIGYVGATAQDFLTEFRGLTGPVDLHLNTVGGDVFDGIAIYSAIRQRGGVNVIVDSLAASIGSVIAMGGETVQMAPGSQMMIHDASAIRAGNASEMRDLADLLDKQSDNIASIYSMRTGQPAPYWRDLMKNEKWFSADEAVSAGLADSVLAGKPLASLGTVITGPAPAADVRDAADSSDWDGSKAMSNGADSDDPAAFYAGICAGRKAGDASKQSSWALPYKYHPGDAPNAAGTRNALARLPQTEGLTNESEARATLQRAMKQVDPEYTAADSLSADIWAEFAQSFAAFTNNSGEE